MHKERWESIMVLRTYNKSIVELVIAALESFLKIKNNANR